MKIKILFLLLPALLLVSCNSDDEQDTPQLSGEQIRFEIGFAGEGDPATRATTTHDFKTSWEDGDEIGLFIVQGNGVLQGGGNYVDNVKLTRQADGSWEPASAINYPSVPDQLDFYAYYPYNGAMKDSAAYTFTIKIDQRGTNYNKSDLMTAKAENVSKSKNAVQLDFSHALSLVQIEVKREVNVPHFDDDMTVTLKKVNPHVTIEWKDNLTSMAKPIDIVMHKVEGMTNIYRALVPTQILSTDSKVTFVQKTTGKEINMTYPGTASTQLTAKATHRYSVTLGWGIDSDHAYAVGDVYPHVGPAVGIVYWVDPTSGGKHGKVVGLKENNGVAWGTRGTVTGPTDMANGRENMKTIYDNFSKTFSGYPAFAWVHRLNDANENYSNPDATGVWYLPARDELGNSLYVAYDTFGKSDFNAKLTAAGGAALSITYYWSSSEDGYDLAWSVIFSDGSTPPSYKGDSGRVRCVLAF